MTKEAYYQGCRSNEDHADLPLCGHCAGSGEGQWDGAICDRCHGSGVQAAEARDDWPDDYNPWALLDE